MCCWGRTASDLYSPQAFVSCKKSKQLSIYVLSSERSNSYFNLKNEICREQLTNNPVWSRTRWNSSNSRACQDLWSHPVFIVDFSFYGLQIWQKDGSWGCFIPTIHLNLMALTAAFLRFKIQQLRSYGIRKKVYTQNSVVKGSKDEVKKKKKNKTVLKDFLITCHKWECSNFHFKWA